MIEAEITVIKISELLSLCLASAIEDAMKKTGSNWFEQLKTEDLNELPKHRIFQHQASIYNCDLQALLKILRFRSCRGTVFIHFGFDIISDTPEGHTRLNQTEKLLDRLITDYRNRLFAHKDAGSVKASLSGDTTIHIYAEEEAIRDMMKLAEIFSSVCNRNGVSYYLMIAKKAEELSQAKNSFSYPLAQMISEEGLDISENELATLCKGLNIVIQDVGTYRCMQSARYEEDLERIRDKLTIRNIYETKAQRLRRKKHLFLSLCVAALFACAVFLGYFYFC